MYETTVITRAARLPRLAGLLLGLLLAAAASASAAASAAAAQERATVTIFLRGPEGPLSGVVLAVSGVTVTGDERGIVRLDMAPGVHEIRARRAGYVPVRVLFDMPARDTTLIFEFVEAPDAGETILVVSTRGDRRIEEEPIRIEVIGREEIEEKLLMTPGSIAMLLNEATGVRVQETSPALGGASVRIQGQRGRYSRILVDGLPLYGYGGALGPLQIPPMDLEQVEVIKGPASALYGPSALAGVINLISRRPDSGREVLANRTSRGGTDVVFWGADTFGERIGVTLLGGLHAQDPADIDGDGWSELARHRRVVLRPRVFWQQGVSTAMATAGLVAESRTGGGFVAGGERYDQEVETVRADLGSNARWAFGSALALDARAAFSHAEGAHLFGTVRENTRQQTAFGELSLRGQTGAHRWVVGSALEASSLQVRPVADMNFRQIVPAVFAQDELPVLPWLTLSVSGRLDHHREHGIFVSPRGALLFGPFGIWTVRLSSGSGFVLPTPLVEEVEEIGFSRLEPPAGLLAERGRSVNADFAATIGPLEFNATLFSSVIHDAVTFVEPAQPGRGTLINLPAPARTRGTELLGRVRFESLGLTLFHTFTDAREPDPVSLRLERMPLTPRHAAGLVAIWESEEFGMFGFETYYTGHQRLHGDPVDASTPAYVLMGALIERRVGPVRVFINAENLGNVRLTDQHPFVRAEPSTVGRWTTDVWQPLEGRVVNGGFRVFF